MDGNSRIALHKSSLVWPNALTLDAEKQILFWADASLDKIESSHVDGTNRQVLTTTGIFHPFAITSFKGSLYWTDWQVDAILSWESENVSILFSELTTEPMGIQVVTKERQLPGKVCSE